MKLKSVNRSENQLKRAPVLPAVSHSVGAPQVLRTKPSTDKSLAPKRRQAQPFVQSKTGVRGSCQPTMTPQLRTIQQFKKTHATRPPVSRLPQDNRTKTNLNVRPPGLGNVRNNSVVQRANGGNDLDRAVRSLNLVHRFADRVEQYINANIPVLNNLLNSNVNIYNGNPLMGATIYQLLTRMNTELDNRYQAYDRAFEAIQHFFGDSIYNAQLEDVFDTGWHELGERYNWASNQLPDILAFFNEYQQWVNAHPNNPTNRPIGGSIFRQYDSTIHPGDMTVRQSMAAEDQIAAYNIRQMRRPPGPPGWQSGNCGRR